MDDATAITNLLFRYAELMDEGDYAGVGALFAHARIRSGPGPDDTTDAGPLVERLERDIIRYDGSPRTRHVTTNPIVEVADDGASATCRSSYAVFQAVEGFPLQPYACGRYHDRFERVDGVWRFSERAYHLDLVGDMGHHHRSASH